MSSNDDKISPADHAEKRPIIEHIQSHLSSLPERPPTIPVDSPEQLSQILASAGELAQFTVGGVDGKWRWLIAGEPMRQAGASNHQAQPGEVLVLP